MDPELIATLAEDAEAILARQPRSTLRFAAEGAVLARFSDRLTDFYGSVRPDKVPEFVRLADAVEARLQERRGAA